MEKRKKKELDFRRKHIIDAARTVFAENGFTETTIEQIAASAEIARATLYKIFPTKEELYLCVVEDVFEGICVVAQQTMDRDVPLKQKLEEYVHQALQHFSSQSGFVKVLIHQVNKLNIGVDGRKRITRIHDRLNDIIADAIRLGIKRKEIRPIDADRAMRVFNHMIYGYEMNNLIRPDSPEVRKQAVQFIIDIFFNGIVKR
ncbi:MAG: TetR/AcrR family transcriptional regulator [Bacteroidota bacterium]